MREHPIPQDITGYKFHIIGSMTLKQFVEIALGVGLAGLIYVSNLPTPIKWALILFSVGLGGMVAFLPIEERPLDHWIITFIKTMYKPTQFFWKREAHVPDVFSYQQHLNTGASEDITVDFGPVRKERIKEYLTSVPNVTDPSAFEHEELQKMETILGFFSSVHTQHTTTQKAALEKPQLGVRVRNLRPTHQENVVYQTTQQTVLTNDMVNTTQEGADLAPAQMYVQQQPTKQQKQVEDVAKEIAVPETELILVADKEKQGAVHNHEEPTTAQDPLTAEQMTFMSDQGTTTATEAIRAAAFNANLPFPESPSEPNKLVGMVLSPNDDLIVNAIIEILKPNGRVVRAVKTNALGQFFITTPLSAGDYTLTVEKDGLTFEPLNISLTDQIVQPIEIRSMS